MTYSTLNLTNSGAIPIRVQITSLQYDVDVNPGAFETTNKVVLGVEYTFILTRQGATETKKIMIEWDPTNVDVSRFFK